MSQQGSQGGGGGSGKKPSLRETLQELLTVDKQALKAYAEFISPFTVFYSFAVPAISMLLAAIGAYGVTFGYSVVVVPFLAMLALPMFVLALIATFTAPLLRVAASVEIRRGPVVILRPLYDIVILLTIGLPYALVWWWAGRLIALFFTLLDSVLVGPAALNIPFIPLPSPTMSVLGNAVAAAMTNALATKSLLGLQFLGINATQIVQAIEQAAQGFLSAVAGKVLACVKAYSQPVNPSGDVALGFAIEFFVIAGGYVLSRARVIRGLGSLNFVVGAVIISSLIYMIFYYYASFVSSWDCVYAVFTGQSASVPFTMGDYERAIAAAGGLGTLILIYFIGRSMIRSMPGFPRRVPLSWNIVILLISASAFAGSIWFAYAMVLVAIYLTLLWLASGDSTWFWYMVVLVPSAYFINLYLATVSSYLVGLFSFAGSFINGITIASYDAFAILVMLYILITILLLLPSLATTLSGINPGGWVLAAILIALVVLLLMQPAALFAGSTIVSSMTPTGMCIANYLLTSPSIQLPIPTCT